jgi:Zn-dependent protease/CBS domain-containing protein
MTRQTVPLGRIFGISVGLDYSWFLIFALMTWLLARSYFPAEFKNWSPALYWGTGAATTIMLFVSVLLHELGHSVVALSYKIPVRRITLFIFGGMAEIGAESPSPTAEFLIAIAGPIVSLILAIIFTLLEQPAFGIPPLFGLIKYLAYINFALVLFNLIPGYPLDGGRVFRAIVWGVTHDMRRATLIAANVGRFFGFLFIMFGVWQMLGGNFGGGLWIAFIGWFLESAASSQVHQVMLQRSIAGHTVGQAMNHHFATLPANLTLQQLVDEHVFGGRGRSFVVNRGDNAVGLITLHRLKEVPRSQWGTTMAEQIMIPIAQIKTSNPKAELWTALTQMDGDGVNQLPVMSDGRIVGMLTREDLITFLRTLQELGE